MGKIRVSTLGDEALEQKQKNEVKKRKEAKKTGRVPGLKGGQRVVAVGPSEEELAKLEVKKVETVEKVAEVKTEKKKSRGARSGFARKKQGHSKRYLEVAKLLDKTKKYPLSDALSLLEKLKRAKFDETVELHINTIETGVSGQTSLPHGTGKTSRVAIANDSLIAEVEKGKINFDMLLSTPQMMPKLAKIARFLGPRGLMPNPKAGTISSEPEKLALKFQKGQIQFKTEAKSPIIHLTVGKLSFGPKKLLENIQAIIGAVKKEKIKSAVLKSTMSPGIKIDLSK